MTDKLRIKVPHGKRIFEVLEEHGKYQQPQLSQEEKAKLNAEKEAFTQRCRDIFERVSPDLIKNHYNWAIMIEPESGDYAIDPDAETAFQKIRQKHPNARIMEKRLNETGCVGRI
ncbi:MAG: hypothetical protein VKN72_10790 [Nostocales cyanobacterium 94392]|nr:hypothetical protein [Nostocales cyanobacterium 94392]